MNISDKINEITKIKRSQQILDFIQHVAKEDFDKAIRLYCCGSWLALRHFHEQDEAKVVNAILCKLTFLCPVCAIRRQAKLFAAAVPKVQTINEENPELKMVMITLTTKTNSSLEKGMEHLRTSYRKMSEASRRVSSDSSKNQTALELNKVRGMIRSFEIKRSKGDETKWNCHLHAFAFIEKWIDVEKLSAEWSHYTGDSFIVDVRQVEKKNEDSDPILSGLSEVIKYPLKFAGLSPQDAWHAHSVLKGARMTDWTGLFRGMRTGVPETDLDIENPSGPYSDFIAQWSYEFEKFDLRETDMDKCILGRRYM